ncbi:MAG: DUF881 domain-containing protein [Dermatophilaceae bacterium]
MSHSKPGADASAGASDRSPWQRLMLMARPRATKANAFAALLAIILGFAVATQVRQNQVLGLESLRQAELVTILDNATLLSSRLDQDARELQGTRDELVNGSTGGAAALKAAQERLDALGILAGTARAHGPGIRVTISDPNAKVTAPLLLDAIEELRDAGAEAIQVGGIRVVASSSFGASGSGVEVDGVTLTEPYSILAIGDAQTMSSAMEIPGGLSENVRQLGASITIAQSTELTVGALYTLREPRYARPVPSPAPAATP